MVEAERSSIDIWVVNQIFGQFGVLTFVLPSE